MNVKYKIADEFNVPAPSKIGPYQYKGTISDYTLLPTKDVEVGHTYRIVDDLMSGGGDNLHYWNGDEWIQIKTPEADELENFLPQSNDTLIPVKVSYIFECIGDVHQQATMKYVPYGWETEFTDKLDSSAICNLQAMLRHTMKMFNNDEIIEDESGLPHTSHLFTRAQMYVTATMRTLNNAIEDRIPDININKGYTSYVNGDKSPNTLIDREPFSFITPEFIFSVANITAKDIANVASQYNELSNAKSVLRRFIIRLYQYINFHQSKMNSMASIVSNGIDTTTYTKELVCEIIVVYALMKHFGIHVDKIS